MEREHLSKNLEKKMQKKVENTCEEGGSPKT